MADIYNPEDQEIIRHLFYLLHLNLYCYTNSTSSCAASGGTSWYEVILKRWERFLEERFTLHIILSPVCPSCFFFLIPAQQKRWLKSWGFNYSQICLGGKPTLWKDLATTNRKFSTFLALKDLNLWKGWVGGGKKVIRLEFAKHTVLFPLFSKVLPSAVWSSPSGFLPVPPPFCSSARTELLKHFLALPCQ